MSMASWISPTGEIFPIDELPHSIWAAREIVYGVPNIDIHSFASFAREGLDERIIQARKKNDYTKLDELREELWDDMGADYPFIQALIDAGWVRVIDEGEFFGFHGKLDAMRKNESVLADMLIENSITVDIDEDGKIIPVELMTEKIRESGLIGAIMSELTRRRITSQSRAENVQVRPYRRRRF